MQILVRKSSPENWMEILELYRKVAAIPGGLARRPEELTEDYVREFLKKAMETGISLIAFQGIQLVGEIHSYKLTPRVFSHVLSELTIAVHPEFQGMGAGKALFTAFLQEVETNRPDILRVELISRESNLKAIRFYESLGFKREGRFEQRIDRGDGTFEADIPMAWINTQFGQK
jgi:putative acetyltransferase